MMRQIVITAIVQRTLARLALCTLMASSVPYATADTFAPPDRPLRTTLTLVDTDGQMRSLADYRGAPVMVHFWASWCAPCLEELPRIVSWRRANRGNQVAIVGVNVGDGMLRVKTLATQLGVDFPMLLDPDSRVFRSWRVDVLPSTFLVDGNGEVRFVAHGPLDWDDLDLAALLRVTPAGERAPSTLQEN